MSLPIDLVLVRHGQSEGNAAMRLSEAGQHDTYAKLYRDRHTASFRLTRLGRKQATEAGYYIRSEFLANGTGFDRYYVSEYIRAMETAALLNLPGAEWLCDYNLTERDWGDLDACPEDERHAKFCEALRRRDIEPFFWRPPNGESFAQLGLRADRVLETLHRECSDKRVLVVCHGEVIRSFQVRLERMSQDRFRELHFSQHPMDRIYNCQVIHYTRRDPESRKLGHFAEWVRWIRPVNGRIVNSGWRRIERPRYSNEELLEVVSRVPVVVE